MKSYLRILDPRLNFLCHEQSYLWQTDSRRQELEQVPGDIIGRQIVSTQLLVHQLHHVGFEGLDRAGGKSEYSSKIL